MLTDRSIQRMKPPETGQRDVADGLVKGLICRFSAGGTRTFYFGYRSPRDGKQARFRLGEYPGLSLSEARDRARQCRGLVDRGVDPRDDAEERVRKAKAEAEENQRLAERKEKNTLANRADEYVAYCRRAGLRTVDERQRHFKVYITEDWRARPLDSFARRDMEELLLAIEKRGPVMANRVMASLSALFTWATRKGFASANPCLGVKSDIPEVSRDRVLSDDELRRVWLALPILREPAAIFLRTLILTGQRRNEVATMRWADLDLNRAFWTIPAARMKMGREHLVPLARATTAGLKTLPRSEGFMFSTDGGQTHLQNFSQIKRTLDRRIGEDMPPWRIHDIRRTAASGMARLGVAPHVIDKILAHDVTITGVAAVYNRHQYLDERRQALTLWADHVLGLAMDGGEGSNIVSLSVKKSAP